MTELAKLSDEGRRLISEELMRGAIEKPERVHLEGLIDRFERKLDLDDFDEAVDRVIAETKRFDTAIDAAAAPELHRTLRLTRREAADPAVWRFLAVVHRPDF